jgi:hypothetical protein
VKVAIYIEQGVTQLGLTPESDWERSATGKLAPDGKHEVTILRGSFYETRGGWTRFNRNPFEFSGEPSEDSSIMIRVVPRVAKAEIVDDAGLTP